MSQCNGLTKTQAKYIKRIHESGYMSVSSIDSLVWRKRQILDGMAAAGTLVKYTISPSYDGYRLPK